MDSRALSAQPRSTERAPVADRDTAARVRLRQGPAWLAVYSRNIGITDAVVITLTVLAGQVIRFGVDLTEPIGNLDVPAGMLIVPLILGWLIALHVTRADDRRILTVGAAEYNRVIGACFGLFGVFAIIDLALNLSVARGFLAFVFPVGTLTLLASRWSWRRWLARRRRKAHALLTRVLVVGGAESARALADRLIGDPSLGYRVSGIIITDSAGSLRPALQAAGRDIRIYRGMDMLCEAASLEGVEAVALTEAGAMGHPALRDLAWKLNDRGLEMLVAPGLVDVAGPRITLRPDPSLPLLHVDRPRYQKANRNLKAFFDRSTALAGLVALAPLLLICAIVIKLDSSGPVFYRSSRMGAGNQVFGMWKFRSMVVGADQMRDELESDNDGNGVLFKLHEDPRVTRVGRVMRRYSLDELPQLLNVLTGEMSLVGPRPPLPEEVDGYDHIVGRRMLVRPGITGLWQVSGRSNLSWEESVKLDLFYVENWSLMGDAIIVWRTVRAVLGKEGAY